jgi:sugar/nucleoside kinase (ribokinase family)
MSAHRSVAVLGPIPKDRITTHRGQVFEKYGCALYTVAALSALLDDDDRIYPIVHVRREDEGPITELLSAFPNVDLTGVRSASDHGAVVELTYVDQNTRIEQQTGFMDPITPEDVEFALHSDAFVCVPITDYEVGQATLAHIKQHSTGTILLDAHGPTSTLVMGGERRRRLWVERDTWLPSIDILKMNLEEAGCSWFPSRIELEHHAAGTPMDEQKLPAFARHCLGHGVQAVCVTLDQRGCVAYWLDEAGELAEQVVPRVPVEHVVDTTGCGDSFAAGMSFGYLQDHDVVRACQYGNAMGAQRAAGSELAIYLSLAETNEQLARTYGSTAPVGS